MGIENMRRILIQGGGGKQEIDLLDRVITRRRFFGQAALGYSVLVGFGAGLDAALKGLFGRGLVPVAWSSEADLLTTKPGMIVHNDRPINGELPPDLLDDSVTPSSRHFVRNNGIVPVRAINKDIQDWKLTIDGEVNRKLQLSIADLKRFPSATFQETIECGGNGRALFRPKVRGNQWNRGAIASSRWTGVRLRDVLKEAGVKSSAVYTAHYGEDIPLGKAEPFSRGIPMAKAMEEHTLIAYQLNGADVPALNGFPVRLVVPGWIGSCSEKWLKEIRLLAYVHDSQKMRGFSYRVPQYPVVPGTRPPRKDMVIVTSWIIKSMITQPRPKTELTAGDTIKVRGHAWAGEHKVEKVILSTDYGIHWYDTELTPPKNKYAWNDWEAELKFSRRGYYEIWARAFDNRGIAQPFRQPWNPKGYLGNVIHRVPVIVSG